MKNIFKATLYRIIKSKITVYSVILSIVFPVVLAVLPLTASDKINAISGVWDNFFFTCSLICLVFLCASNCSDYRNKTINLEVMNGHSPYEIFAGRFLAFVICNEVLFNAGLLITHVILSINIEYTTAIRNSGFNIKKLFVIEIIFLAYLSYYMFCSFAARNVILSIVLAWFGFCVSGIVGLFDNMINSDRSLSSYVGPYTIKFLIMENYSSEQLIIVTIIPFILTGLFLLLGIINVKEQEF